MVTAVADDETPHYDPRGPELVYMLVADDVAAKIAAGTLAPGARLMGEAEMAEHYHVAKMTARRAVRELRERHLVRTVVGKGSYVL
jgi:DNA-binding GntR family transcriptional regulator